MSTRDGRVQLNLTPEQKSAFEAAIEHGYYEVPRQRSVTEIAAEVGVSSSTFHYRLNRAEVWLAYQFAADSVAVDADTDIDPEDIEFRRRVYTTLGTGAVEIFRVNPNPPLAEGSLV
ncbi:helix-turn-helix domain-containing protein [Haloterrigena salinisoli]|uniref:helix-turn-helix domain-containing protein n=1 Tax=Haloterrigena salinisoli TaxID=3132747 RepID=UPI0030CB47BE